MLRLIFLLFIVFSVAMPAVSRTNAEIGRELYSVANSVRNVSPSRAAKMYKDIDTFLIELSMLRFDESSAVWKKLPSGYLYDETTVQHFFLRHIGVYKSPNGNMMGIFDLNCEDENDVSHQMYQYVSTIDVYFSATERNKSGHSKGFAQTFCKKSK